MKKWLSIMMTASLLLYPFAGVAQDYGPQTSKKQQAPPVAQTLVREGDFAIKLAVELNLGNPANEAAAEDILARSGISPLNGWISDYPITPEIVGQIGYSIIAATDEGKLLMTPGEATEGLYSLASQMNLPTPAGQGSGTAPEGSSSPTVVNNYYYDEGPPIISYYPPPADYVYLYDWVPYPAFWFGFWFPGFFICHNFTHTVVVSNVGFVTRTAIVSNRIINPATRTVTAIDPVVRTSTGTVRPMTALRTGSGQLFRTAADMSRGVTLNGVTPVRTGTAITSGNAAGRGGFKTLEARKGAQAIYSRSVQGMSVRNGGTIARSSGTRNAAPGSAGRSYSAPSRGSEGWGGSRGSSSRSYYNRPVTRDSGGYGRGYAAPSSSSRAYSNGGGFGRSYTTPSAPQRSFSSSMNRGGGVSRPLTFRGMGWGRRM